MKPAARYSRAVRKKHIAPAIRCCPSRAARCSRPAAAIGSSMVRQRSICCQAVACAKNRAAFQGGWRFPCQSIKGGRNRTGRHTQNFSGWVSRFHRKSKVADKANDRESPHGQHCHR
jgi:hypothetical protein